MNPMSANLLNRGHELKFATKCNTRHVKTKWPAVDCPPRRRAVRQLLDRALEVTRSLSKAFLRRLSSTTAFDDDEQPAGTVDVCR